MPLFDILREEPIPTRAVAEVDITDVRQVSGGELQIDMSDGRVHTAFQTFFEAVEAGILEATKEGSSEAERFGFTDDAYPARGSHREQPKIRDSIHIKVDDGWGELVVDSPHAHAWEYGAGPLGGSGGLIWIVPRQAHALLIPLELIRSYKRVQPKRGRSYFRKTTPHGIDKDFEEGDPRVVTIGGKRYIFAMSAHAPGQKPHGIMRKAMRRNLAGLRSALRSIVARQVEEHYNNVRVEVKAKISVEES